MNNLTLLESNSFHSLIFPTNVASNIAIGIAWPREKTHVIILAANTTLHIARILVMRPRSGSLRRSVQIIGSMVDAAVDAAVDTVEDEKVTAISGARSMIISDKYTVVLQLLGDSC